LIGRAADGWVPGGGMSRVDDFPALIDRIDAAAIEAGRDPASIRRVVNVSGTIGDADPRSGGRFAPGADAGLAGPPNAWVDTLATWADRLGLDSFVLWPGDNDAIRQIELYATEVAPAVREALG
jgi:alkanesulfonate monooxygenase SsuD/methylene tetrahydromethanopterin reductase-like flavin-dependent oxidoreductase (luciferase family)